MKARAVDIRVVALLITAIAIAMGVWLVESSTQDVSGAVIGNPGTAAYYIKFDGIDGEAVDTGHQGWSDILSFDQALRSPVTSSTGAGSTLVRSRGDVVLEDIVLVKEIDKASPKLAEAVAKGTIFPSVQLHVTSSYSDAGRVTYYTYELKNVLVTSYSVGGSGTVDDVPIENVSLNFEEIKVTYTENDAAGRSKGNVEFTLIVNRIE